MELSTTQNFLPMPTRTSRDTRTVKKRSRLFIGCEGVTEANYFAEFEVPQRICTMKGYGLAGKALYDKVVATIDRETVPFQSVWLVFDKDNLSDAEFDRVCHVNSLPKTSYKYKTQEPTNETPLHIIWSNPAFELWIVLHFCDWSKFCNSDEIRREAMKLLGIKDSKELKSLNDLRARLLKHNPEAEKAAIARAIQLQGHFQPEQPNTNHNYANQNPATMLYKLVNELKRIK